MLGRMQKEGWACVALCLLVCTQLTTAATVREYSDEPRDHPEELSRVPDNVKIFPRAPLEDGSYWYSQGQAELVESLNSVPNTNVAKNVIFFLGDGLSVPTLTAARIYKGQQQGASGEEYKMVWEDFPDLGAIKTYAVDKQVSDSASTATAYLCGSKANYGTVGVDATVTNSECTTVNEGNKLSSVAQWALDEGKRAGVVTNTRITHATPSGIYARSATRDWECDDDIDLVSQASCPDLKDIARQLIEDYPGRDLNVIMGGGYQALDGDAGYRSHDPTHSDCTRKDGRNLFQEWQTNQAALGRSHAAVRWNSELQQTDLNSVDYLMGIFSNGHQPYEWEKREDNIDMPTLAQMTEAAITVLDKGDKGFFLLVEGGKIDLAHHGNKFNTAVDETAALDDAVRAALAMVDTKDTLVLMTADHSHVTSMNGYPLRGQDITGIASLGDDDLPYTTLMYANGPGYDGSYEVSRDGSHVVRRDISRDNVSGFTYQKPAAVPKDTETHGGDDVLVFATGPMSHLFQRTHEQNYIAHVVGYASCTGPNKDHCMVPEADKNM